MLHKETCYATTLDKEGEIIERRAFKNEREEWERFVGEMPRDSKVAIEACSYWYPVCDFLEERGIEMILTHPSKTRIIAEAKIKHEFSDLFGVEGRNYLRAIELPESQRIARDVLLRQLESVDNDIEYVQKRIAVIANEDTAILLLMTETEERERDKDRGGRDGKEAAQGNILHAEQEGKLPV